METIKVKINQDGITANELCSVKRIPSKCSVNLYTFEGCKTCYFSYNKKFEIKNIHHETKDGKYYIYNSHPEYSAGYIYKELEPNSIHTAEVIIETETETKIRII